MFLITKEAKKFELPYFNEFELRNLPEIRDARS
jgi:hypothetical protein